MPIMARSSKKCEWHMHVIFTNLTHNLSMDRNRYLRAHGLNPLFFLHVEKKIVRVPRNPVSRLLLLLIADSTKMRKNINKNFPLDTVFWLKEASKFGKKSRIVYESNKCFINFNCRLYVMLTGRKTKSIYK